MRRKTCRLLMTNLKIVMEREQSSIFMKCFVGFCEQLQRELQHE